MNANAIVKATDSAIRQAAVQAIRPTQPRFQKLKRTIAISAVGAVGAVLPFMPAAATTPKFNTHAEQAQYLAKNVASYVEDIYKTSKPYSGAPNSNFKINQPWTVYISGAGVAAPFDLSQNFYSYVSTDHAGYWPSASKAINGVWARVNGTGTYSNGAFSWNNVETIKENVKIFKQYYDVGTNSGIVFSSSYILTIDKGAGTLRDLTIAASGAAIVGLGSGALALALRKDRKPATQKS